MSSLAKGAPAENRQPRQNASASFHGLREVAITLPYLSPVIYGAGLVFVMVGACMAFYQGRSSVSVAGFVICLFACGMTVLGSLMTPDVFYVTAGRAYSATSMLTGWFHLAVLTSLAGAFLGMFGGRGLTEGSDGAAARPQVRLVAITTAA